MNIKFRQGSEEVSQKLIDRAQIKLSKLSRYITERNFEAQVYVDIERESGANHSESMWRASVNLHFAGDRFNASEKASTAEKATDLAIKELKSEIRRSKTKQLATAKREGSFFKQLNRGLN